MPKLNILRQNVEHNNIFVTYILNLNKIKYKKIYKFTYFAIYIDSKIVGI